MLRFGAYQDDVAGFDAGAFRLARGEAVALDPQSRVLLHQIANARQVCCAPRLPPLNPSGAARHHRVTRSTPLCCCMLTWLDNSIAGPGACEFVLA